MRTAIAWTLLSVLLLPLFAGAALGLVFTDPVAKAQRILVMANQATQTTQLIEQLTELRAQFQHIRESTLGQIQPLTQPFTDLSSSATGLVSDTMSWKSDFTGVPGQLANAIGEMGASGTSLSGTWRTRNREVDTVTEADVIQLHDDQPADLIERAKESWKNRREQGDQELVMSLALADAAAELAKALREAQAKLTELQGQTNVSTTALGQAQLAGAVTQGNLTVGVAQVQAYRAAKEASEAAAAEAHRKDLLRQYNEAQTTAKTALTARLAAIDADRDAMRERTRLQVHSFYGASYPEQQQ